jgi:cell filamentation protein
VKSSQMQACIDFIRFSMEVEGATLEDGQERQIMSILDEDVSADQAVEEVIREAMLDENFIPSDEENGHYLDTRTLVNYFNIEERNEMINLECRIIPLRMAEIFLKPIPTKFDFELLKEIHTVLFGDIYPSAGEIRHFDASKRTSFCKPQYINQMANTIFSKLFSDRYLTGRDRESFVNDLAFYMGEVEALHPFFDGNGRTARVFFYLLALNAGYDLKWYEMDPDRLLEADISAIDGEYQPLVSVLAEVLVQ